MKAEYDGDDPKDQDQENSNNTGSNSNQGGNNQGGANRERDRDRRGRGDRGTRFSDADPSGGGNRDRSRERRNCRIYVSNIPYDYRWQDLKDLFRRVVGSVEYVELFNDENGKPRGCGIVEFKDPDNVEKALEKMNRYEINGREIVVKEDHGENRDQYGRIVRDGMGGGGGGGVGGGGGGGVRDRDRFNRRDRDDDRMSGRQMGVGGGGMMAPNDYGVPYDTYGLSTSFLESLGINGPLHTKVFVANLDYKVDSKKLKQVFKLAGKVQSVDLSVDKEGNSRGFAVIEYDHPVEAVQAISMFDRQMLYDRRMTVRLDRIPDKNEGSKLPEGLGGIGIGLGPNGEPLRDVARNLPNMTQGNSQTSSNLGGGGGGLNPNSAPVPVAPPLNSTSANLLNAVASAPVLTGLSSSHLAALSNVVGDLKSLTGVSNVLSNRLLTNSLSSLGLNLGGNNASQSGAVGGGVGGVGGVGDNTGNSTVPSANDYTTGNNYNSGYSSTSFNTGAGGRNDFETSVRNFNQQQQDGPDFGSGGFGSNMGGGRKSDTIVIKNIPISCTWQTLRDKFRDIGEVKFAEIRGNDLGVVRFFKEKDAELAIKLMDGSRMDGRTVNVSFF